ncbi:hypothetical protein ACRC7T_09120 [Segnochrobactraceae bacterium EtOH-i3]
MRAALAILMMVAATLLSACTTTRGPDPALAARIEFPKPKGWVVTTRQQWLSNPDWELSYTDYGVRQIKYSKVWYSYYYSKYPEPADFLNPDVTVMIADEKVANFMAADVYLDGIAQSLKKIVKEVEIIAPVRNTTISGLPAAETTVQSVIYLSSGRKQRFLTRFWAVRVENQFVVIAADWPADGKLATEAEMMRIVNTIRILPAAR